MTTNKLTVRDITTMFPSPRGQGSCAYWVPIHMLEEVREAFRNEGIRIRCRFRGPRTNQIGLMMPTITGGTYRRSHRNAMQDCLKAYATHFCVYTDY